MSIKTKLEDPQKEIFGILPDSKTPLEAEKKITSILEERDKEGLLYGQGVQKKLNLSSIFINYGIDNQKIDFLKRGLEMAKEVESLQGQSVENRTLFNIANANQFLATYYNKKLALFPQNKYFQEAKKYYQKIWKNSSSISKERLKGLVSLGGLMSSVGRVVEAVDLFDKVIAIDPHFGMAYYRKYSSLFDFVNDMLQVIPKEDKTEAKNVSVILVKDLLTYCLTGFKEIKNSDSLLDSIKEVSTLDRVKEDIKQKTEWIEQYIQKDFIPEKKESKKDKKIDSFVSFMEKNNLFLSFYFMDRSDSFGHYNTPILDYIKEPLKTKIDMMNVINEIKESYLFACEQVFLFDQNEDENFTVFLDKSAWYQNELGTLGLKNGRRTRQIKICINESYNIFDKIMLILETFLETGKEPKKVMWQSGFNPNRRSENDFWLKKDNTFSEKIANLEKPKYLIALYDLKHDLESKNGVYRDIKNKRNAITHRFLDVKKEWDEFSPNSLTQEDLYKTALDSLHITKSAIIYLVMFLKEKSSEEKGLSMPAYFEAQK
jgi:tetratricopeptide (TPR) repeat protein